MITAPPLRWHRPGRSLRASMSGAVALGRKQRRAGLIVCGVAILGLATGLILFALNDAIVFFHTPSELAAKAIAPGQRVRVGGLVAPGSLQRSAPSTVTFAITDLESTTPVSYTGQLPDLFREGQGVVAEGMLDASGRFIADTVLAKHDENYMPKEVADALKAKGVWKGVGE
jgi:cytochrome c-type biogenesis protein CcmE